MRRLVFILVAAIPLFACGPSEADIANTVNAQVEAEVARRLAAVEAPRKAGENTTPPSTKAAESVATAEAEPAGAMDDLGETEVAAVEMCWQDYCPCEPPQGGPDEMICRRLRAGLPVDDELFSAGAGLRDAREQLEEFNREYGSY